MNDWLRLKLAGKKPDDIRKTLDKRYANLACAACNELKTEDVFQTFLNAYSSAIDPHTDYFTPRTAENFNQSMSLSLEGIGAVLQRQDDMVVIREIVPAARPTLNGKLKVGDRIVPSGQGKSGPMTDVIGWRIDDVVAQIRGKKDTQVRLDVHPAEAGIDGKHAQVTITRAEGEAGRTGGQGRDHHAARRQWRGRAPHRRDQAAGVLPGLRRPSPQRERLQLGHARHRQAAGAVQAQKTAGWRGRTCATTAAARWTRRSN
jgi:C-terminal processing protease CtpA/Prc